MQARTWVPLPCAQRHFDPFDADALNAELLPHGLVYGAGLESFYFAGPPDPLTARIYESFGAPLGLSITDTEAFRGLAEQQAGEIFAGLKTKWDVVNIAVDGVPIGDLIYDTYLRLHAAGKL